MVDRLPGGGAAGRGPGGPRGSRRGARPDRASGVLTSLPGPLRVIIADDHALFCQGLKSMFKLQPEVSVAAEVGRVSDLLPALTRTPAGILLLHVQMARTPR